ncbi:junctophilin-1 [Pelobates cultripes]|uniref:Junctophilin-1 n=1 Tax=Pelobates cultripes TaxID=61616 RepID=A0AAD1W6K8_PELCU|nr:junctophilin-1 [Pelobates cultripes]
MLPTASLLAGYAPEKNEMSAVHCQRRFQETQIGFYFKTGTIQSSMTAHARAKGDAADQASQAARQESDIARAVAKELSPSFHQPGPDYMRQKFQEVVEVKEVVEEKVQKKPPSPKESPHFYRKGTTPPNTPEERRKQTSQSSSQPTKIKNSSSSAVALHNPERKSSSSENLPASSNKPLPVKVPEKEEGIAKPLPKASFSHNPSNTGNGELHADSGYFIKINPLLTSDLKAKANPSKPSAFTNLPQVQMPSPKKPVVKPDAKESRPEPKLKKQDSVAPKNETNNNDSLSTIGNGINSRPSSVLIMLVMLLNVGLAILFVHFLT